VELKTANRIEVDGSDEGGLRQGMLKINNLEKNDEAMYKCVARNEATNEDDPPTETQAVLTIQSKWRSVSTF